MRRLRTCLTYLWVSPATLVGLCFVPPALATGGGCRIVQGVLEVHGGAVRFFLRRCVPLKGGARAMTLGHVVIGCDCEVLDQTRPHERVHVRQCERWGPLFIPAYLLASAAALLRGGRIYRDNCFEREAFDDAEG